MQQDLEVDGDEHGTKGYVWYTDGLRQAECYLIAWIVVQNRVFGIILVEVCRNASLLRNDVACAVACGRLVE